MKALKAFIKHFEAPQRSVKILSEIQFNFYFNTTFGNARGEKAKIRVYLKTKLLFKVKDISLEQRQ